MTTTTTTTVPPKPKPKPTWTARRVVREVAILAAFALAFLSARSSIADHYHVPSGSMMPTVEIGDRIVVSKAAYGVRVPFTRHVIAELDGPARGDVVVLESPDPGDDGKVLLKRVAAVPGDRVAVRHGQIFLAGRDVKQETRADGTYEILDGVEHRIELGNGPGPDLEEIVIPPERYLVLGDNRGDSRDGRELGLVPRENILGRAARVYWRGGPAWTPL
ncbi:MAG: signal peptidase I [Deltaproteobacteria bacterium]|nr:signal peptidase I [Deltaproteobacteria bacterium]